MVAFSKLSAFLVGSLMLLAAFSPALAIPNLLTAPALSIASINGRTVDSLNWSGYAVTGSTGSVTSVSGSWIVPAVTGASNSYAACWTGIDGYSDGTVEQTGTISYMSGTTPAYYAWYEFYPAAMVELTSTTTGMTGSGTVLPGDIISATVTYVSGTTSSSTFSVSISDAKEDWSFSATLTAKNAYRSSAEWIVEAPSSGREILPLADFKAADFGNYYTSQASTCYATVNSVTGGIGSFGTSVQTINMVTNRGVAKDSTSALVDDASEVPDSFYVTWESSGSSGGAGPGGFGR